MERIMELIYKDHKKWVNIVKNFGCNHTTAEDIVSEMYIKIQRLIEKGTDIMFDSNSVNYFYIFRCLNSLFIDLKRKEKNINQEDIETLNLQSVIDTPNYTAKYDKIKAALDALYWYDKRVYELIEGGESIAGLSKKTNISYYSLYNTYTRVKKYLKSLL
jgi:DNA-directed RNA polymerase specialized sigma24 family protein